MTKSPNKRLITLVNIDDPPEEDEVAANARAEDEVFRDEHMQDPSSKDLAGDIDSIKDWRTEIKMYIAEGEVPKDRWVARRLKA